MSDLGTIDGQPIVGRSIKLTKAGDGLSEALQIEHHDLHVGDEVAVLVRGKIGGPTFKPEKGSDSKWVRVDNIVAGSALIVEDEDVTKILDKHDDAVYELRQRLKEEKEGLKRLDFPEEDDHQQAAEDGLGPDDTRPLSVIEGGGEGDDDPDDAATRAGI